MSPNQPPSPPGDTPPNTATLLTTADADLDRAAAHLNTGSLVALPTETVYGLAADATNANAITKIYETKQRPRFNPLIAHVTGIEMAQNLVTFSPLALRLAERFWPGPLTLVLPRTSNCTVSDLACAGLNTLAVRHPKNTATTGIIARLNRPIVAPSANPSEHLSPTTAEHVANHLGTKLRFIVDGGTCQMGVESTIVAVEDNRATLLRPGALARDEIETITGQLRSPNDEDGIQAPGMMKRHYAPNARLRLNAQNANADEAFLAFGPTATSQNATFNLSPNGDLTEAAANLFIALHNLDKHHAAIAIAPIPNHGLGEAINDRLIRAAARIL